MAALSSESNGDRIARVESWTCAFNLPAPLVFEDFEIAAREYIVVRITTDDGVEGVAYALTRGAPTGVVLEELIAARIIGWNALAIPRIQRHVERSLLLLGTEGLPQRALSLVDICLWDIKAKRAGLPLWQLLGGFRDVAPALLVDWYPQPRDRAQDVVDHLTRRAEQGYDAFKLHTLPEAEATRSLVKAAREAIGRQVELVLDAGMRFHTPLEAIAAIGQWTALRPAWVEDPFRGDRPEDICRVREASAVPIGAGDEVASPGWIRQLLAMDAVDVLRLDATIHGGFTGFGSLTVQAADAGVPVSPHVYPEIHQHCVFAWSGVDYVEVFAPESEYDCAEAFISTDSVVRAVDGRVLAPTRVGLGLELDWDRVQTQATHRTNTSL